MGTISLGRNNSLPAVQLHLNLIRGILDIQNNELRGTQKIAIDFIRDSKILTQDRPNPNLFHEGYVIIGPPGTGKTFVICLGALLFLERVDRNHRPNTRWDQVAIVTFTNAAANRVIQEFNNIFDRLKVPIPNRLGLVRRIYLDRSKIDNNFIDFCSPVEKPAFMNSERWDVERNHCDAARIFVGTVFAIRKAIKGRRNTSILKKIQQSLILFDEASQINISQFNLSLYSSGKHFKVVGLVGDPSQLPPVKQIKDLQKDVISTLLGTKGDARKITRQVQLNVQSRMHPIIKELSQLIGNYPDIISDYPTTKINDLGNFLNPKASMREIDSLLNIDKRVIILDDSHHPNSSEDQVGTSRINKMEAQAAKILAEVFLKCYPDLQSDDILVIVPYTRQSEEIRSDKFRSGTVDSFQGQEAKLVIASTVRTDPEISLDFVTDLQRMNVLVSRAKSKLVILNHRQAFEKNDLFQKIFAFMAKNPDETEIIEYSKDLENELKNLIK